MNASAFPPHAERQDAATSLTVSSDAAGDSPTRSPTALVVIDRLTRIYGTGPRGVHALGGVTLTLSQGEFVTILGPSGCGKSTLLNIIAGFDAPTSGRVLVAGEEVSGPSPARGVVFQDSAALFPWFTVAGNVAFGLKAGGRSSAEIKERTRKVLKLVGLSEFADKYPKELSGGMRQLVAIARVLVMDVQLLLLDEPFAALDAISRQRMQEQLMDICLKAGTTNLFITHSVDEAIYLADRVLIMSSRPGSIKAQIDVTLSRPRDIASLEFNALRGQALALLA
jgi:NitT/TauT family transport system ATP-binding protein